MGQTKDVGRRGVSLDAANRAHAANLAAFRCGPMSAVQAVLDSELVRQYEDTEWIALALACLDQAGVTLDGQDRVCDLIREEAARP